MANNDLNSKIEEALKAVIDDLGLTGVTVNTGLDDDTLEVPYVVCSAMSGGEEHILGTGTYNMDAQVIVCSSADDETLATHRTRAAQVFDQIRDDGIEATLAGKVTDFHVFYVRQTGMTQEFDENKFRSTLELELVCCPTDVS